MVQHLTTCLQHYTFYRSMQLVTISIVLLVKTLGVAGIDHLVQDTYFCIYIYTYRHIQKIREVFNTYASPELYSHLTLGLTQNANESLHNMIWSRCPKNVYVSPKSIRINTALAILAFNESELSLFGILTDFGLSPSRRVFRSIYCRIIKLQSFRISQAKSNTKRRRRRLKLAKEV